MNTNGNTPKQIQTLRSGNVDETQSVGMESQMNNSTGYGHKQSAQFVDRTSPYTSTIAMQQAQYERDYVEPATSRLGSTSGQNGEKEQKSISGGLKYDGGKPPMDLLDSLALEGLAKVLDFGRIKYAAHNWRGGLSYSRLLGAALRHTFAILRGEDNDPESGLPHVDHLGCCWMFLSNMMKTRPDLDDRYKEKKSA